MKKRIKKREYNTETAERVAEYYSPLDVTDFYYYEETLYRKNTGEFFLYGQGNAATHYSKPCLEGRVGGENIAPLTYDEAEKWAEEHLSGEEVDKIFGEPDESELVHRSFYISKAAAEKIKRIASGSGASISDTLNKLILEK